MKYHIITYGCQMNRSDAERLATVLEKIGYKPIKADSSAEALAKADLVAIVSCSVRQTAIDRVYGQIHQIMKSQEHKNKKAKIIVTGCLTEVDKKKLAKQVDLIFDIKDLNKLPDKLPGVIPKLKNQNSKLQLKTKNYLEIKPRYSTYPIAYVPIMTGCDNFCTYCVVPYTRGREVSRPAQEILQEIGEVVKNGYKMIILLGQNVNSYKSQISNLPAASPCEVTQAGESQTNSKFKIQNSKKEIISFPQLLKMVNDLPGNFWLTFITSHPKDLSDELIETMARGEKIMPYLHLPVQAGNNEVLRRMNRHYTIAHYKRLIRSIRDKFDSIRNGLEKNICISTDIIVGFPGETKKQFSDTAKLMRQIKFDMAYLAKYSPRPGTAAWHLPDNVSAQEKEKRWKILAEILKKTALENNKKYLNKIIEVLIEKSTIMNDGSRVAFGKTKTYKNVKIYNSKFLTLNSNLVGQFVKVKITKVIPWGLEGIV